jgi:alpha-L-rhamnosidase
MISLLQCSTVFLFLLCSALNGVLLPPFDVRIDHYKVDTIRDLIVNTPCPRFSWKVPVINHVSERNIQQIAYQFQLHLCPTSKLNTKFEYDTGYIRSTQSVHVPYTGSNDLMPATNYCFRLRIWSTASEQPTPWTKLIPFRTSIFDLHNYVTKKANLLWIGSTKINMNELRKEFMVPNVSSIRMAIAYISGIGYYELFLNGNKVDPSRKLDPGWTTYAKRTLVVSFDLTPNITVIITIFFYYLIY